MSTVSEVNRYERMDSKTQRMNGMVFRAQGEETAWNLEKYFAREGVDPLSHAFDGKIAVHPGVSGELVPSEDMENCLNTLLGTPRKGDSVAYIHVPFCETHCLYCGFYNRGYSKNGSARYTDTLAVVHPRLWRRRISNACSRRCMLTCPLPTIVRLPWKGVCTILVRKRWRPALTVESIVFP